jgi:hypothetical protein
MLIKFKNKMTMALNKMIEDGKRLGGMPSHIEVSPNEAIELFSEIRRLSPPGFVITSKEGASCKLLLIAKDLTEFEMAGYLSKWKQGEWKVEFSKITVVVIDPPPQTMHLHS